MPCRRARNFGVVCLCRLSCDNNLRSVQSSIILFSSFLSLSFFLFLLIIQAISIFILFFISLPVFSPTYFHRRRPSDVLFGGNSWTHMFEELLAPVMVEPRGDQGYGGGAGLS